MPGRQPDAAFAALETRVQGLEDGVKSIIGTLNHLSGKIEERNKTPWAVIWSAMGVGVAVLLGVGGLVYRPIDAAQIRLETELRVLEGKTVPRAEHVEKWRTFERDLERHEERLNRLDRRT